MALDLVYNSKVWQRIRVGGSSRMVFDVDDDWPAPGWSLGFGKLVELRGGVAMFVEPDGRRHPVGLLGEPKTEGHLLSYRAYAKDASGIGYTFRLTDDPDNPRLEDGLVVRPNGTRIEFGAQAPDRKALYPTRLTDANGNTITIRYRDSGAPSIDRLTDTCGRVIRFLYDEVNLGRVPLGLAGPGTGPGGEEVELVRIQYGSMTVHPTFLEPVLDEPGVVEVITGIYYPATGTGFSFPLSSYSTYGMVRTVRACRGMSIAGQGQPIPGTIMPGLTSSQRTYDYPDAGAALTGPPTYRTLTETWDGQTGGPSVTRFQVEDTGQVIRNRVTLPDGSQTIQEAKVATALRPGGLTDSIETRSPDGHILQRGEIDWEITPSGEPHVREARAFNGRGEHASTIFMYGTTNHVPTIVDEWDWAPARRILRRTRIEFVTTSNYLDRGLRNLPEWIRVFGPFNPDGPDPTVPDSIVGFAYDQASLAAIPNALGYDDRFLPTSSSYEKANAFRGNATTVHRYPNAAERTDPVTEHCTYDLCGNLLTSAVGVSRVVREFHSGYQYLNPHLVTQGPSDSIPFGARVTTLRAHYAPDGRALWTEDSEGRRSEFVYDSAGRPKLVTLTATGAICETVYDDASLTQIRTYKDGSPQHAIVTLDEQRFDGQGRPLQVSSQSPNGLDQQDHRYDGSGRPAGTTMPFRQGQSPAWSSLRYDALGRIVRRDAPDGAVTRWFFDEQAHPSNASPATVAGSCVRVVLPGGRQQWRRLGPYGDVLEVVVPDPDGDGTVLPTGAICTLTDYDSGSRPLTVTTSLANGATQVRRFLYDSLGRLIRAYLPEAGDGIADDRPGHAERWSRTWGYDERSNLITSHDSRGIITFLEYDGDSLDRVKRVRHSTKRFHDIDHPVVECPLVEYRYANDGDPRKVWMTDTKDVFIEIIKFDDLGLEIGRSMFHPGSGAFPFELDAPRDSLGRRTSITYPALYGDVDPAKRTVVTPAYGIGNRLNLLTVDGTDYASGLTWAPGGRPAELKVGPVGPAQTTETYTWMPKSPDLQNQKVTRDGTPLLDLTYEYGPATVSPGGDPAATLHRQLASITDPLTGPAGRRTYAYDLDGRLTGAAGGDAQTPDWSQQYRYDAWGNRTLVAADGDVKPGTPVEPDGLTGLTYDPSTNRITSDGFDYDAAGHLVLARLEDGTSMEYQYDTAGRLAYAKNVKTGEATGYVYGADNRRRAQLRITDTKWPPGSDPTSLLGNAGSVSSGTFYVWDGDNVIAEYEDTGPEVGKNLVWRHQDIYLGSRLLARHTHAGAGSIETTYVHSGLGSTRYVTGSAGGGSAHEPLPYGTSTLVDGSAPYPFTSYDRGRQSRLDYAVNRFYLPELGRFLQPDPMGASALNREDSQSLNSYAYCGNDPLNRVDPLGLIWQQVFVYDYSILSGYTSWDYYHVETSWAPDPEDKSVASGTETGSAGPNRGGGGINLGDRRSGDLGLKTASVLDMSNSEVVTGGAALTALLSYIFPPAAPISAVFFAGTKIGYLADQYLWGGNSSNESLGDLAYERSLELRDKVDRALYGCDLATLQRLLGDPTGSPSRAFGF